MPEPDPDPIPTLLQLLFGDSARAAQEGASERLLQWARAFDDWLEERASIGHKYTKNPLRLAWRHLLSLVKKSPWQITPGDIESYRVWLENRGLSTITIHSNLRYVSQFFEWCGQHSIDPEWGVSFNPARDVAKPKIQHSVSKLLSHQEAEALLAGLKEEQALLSQRDYAFFLCRLRIGAPSKLLRELKWGQIETKEGRAWVNWGPGRPMTQLPGEVWEAILSYLENAGRIGKSRPDGMPVEAFIFAPLIGPYGSPATGTAEEWDEGRCLSPQQLTSILKVYARKVGIDADKLNLRSLRVSVAAWNLKDSMGKVERDAFLSCLGRGSSSRYLWNVRETEQKQTPRVFNPRLPTSPRNRHPNKFTREGAYRHGYWAPDLLPADQIAEILAAGITHMKEETEGLSYLMDRAMQLLENCLHNHRAYMQLGSAHSLCSARLVELLEFEKEGAAELDKWDAWGVETIQWWCDTHGEPVPDLETIWRWVDEADPPNAAQEQGLARHIASDRLILRNLKAMASETGDPIAYAGLLEKYCHGCARLVKLLKEARPQPGRIQAYAERILGKMLADWMEARGFPRGDETYPPVIKK